MLEDGTYREHREVSYYVDCLCITSKYLSEVLKKVSRYAANYWINRYTIFDISRLLSDKSLSFVQISDMFSFSSQAYLSRYVQQNLGFNPTDKELTFISDATHIKIYYVPEYVGTAVRGEWSFSTRSCNFSLTFSNTTY